MSSFFEKILNSQQKPLQIPGKYSNHLGTHLKTLFQEAESKIYNLSSTEDLLRQSENSRASISSIIIGNTSSSVSGCTGSESDKQIGLWERRLKGLRRMIQGWEFTNVPNALRNFKICVTNVTSVSIALLEPNDGPIVTKFKGRLLYFHSFISGFLIEQST